MRLLLLFVGTAAAAAAFFQRTPPASPSPPPPTIFSRAFSTPVEDWNGQGRHGIARNVFIVAIIIISSAMGAVLSFTLLARCVVRHQQAARAQRMREIAARPTVAENDLEDELREPPSIPADDADDGKAEAGGPEGMARAPRKKAAKKRDVATVPLTRSASASAAKSASKPSARKK